MDSLKTERECKRSVLASLINGDCSLAGLSMNGRFCYLANQPSGKIKKKGKKKNGRWKKNCLLLVIARRNREN